MEMQWSHSAAHLYLCVRGHVDRLLEINCDKEQRLHLNGLRYFITSLSDLPVPATEP